MGTADVADTVIPARVAELLASPTWGVVRYVKNAAAKVIFDIGELHNEAASGDMPAIAAWDAAHRAARSARAAARAISPTLDASGLHAVRAAHQSTAIANTDNWVKLDAVTGHALRAHELVAGEFAARGVGPVVQRPAGWTRRLPVTRKQPSRIRRLGCAMNAISYISGDPAMTDFPERSARPLVGGFGESGLTQL
jgi:hypothetical protein